MYAKFQFEQKWKNFAMWAVVFYTPTKENEGRFEHLTLRPGGCLDGVCNGVIIRVWLLQLTNIISGIFLHIVYEFGLKFAIMYFITWVYTKYLLDQWNTLFIIWFEITLIQPCVINILQGVLSAIWATLLHIAQKGKYLSTHIID